MKNLLKLGQGPRPDLLFEEEEKAKKSDTQPDGQSRKSNLKKVFAQSEKKPKRKRVKKRKSRNRSR
ncbi:MAG: hypothetical protein ACLT5U_00770 [Mediterraneibacter gnavus]